MCASTCSPLMVYYRDTSTALYRVQQHCRQLVPRVSQEQAACVASARAAQRGVLDAVDSLAVIDTLNGPVTRSFGDVAKRTTRCVELLDQLARERREDERATTTHRRALDAAAAPSLPTTPFESERRQPRTPASVGSINGSFASPAPVTSISSPSPARRPRANTPAATASFTSPPTRAPASSPSHARHRSQLFTPPPAPVREEDEEESTSPMPAPSDHHDAAATRRERAIPEHEEEHTLPPPDITDVQDVK